MKARQRQSAGKLAVGEINQREEAVLNKGGSRSDSVLFDFAFDGGAVSTLDFGRMIPAGAIVAEIIADEISALTSGGSATLQLKAGSTNLTDALAFDTGFGGSATLALASSATAIKVAAESELKLAIAGAALTAGKVRFFVRYVLPND